MIFLTSNGEIILAQVNPKECTILSRAQIFKKEKKEDDADDTVDDDADDDEEEDDVEAKELAKKLAREYQSIYTTPLVYRGRLYLKGPQELVCLDIAAK